MLWIILWLNLAVALAKALFAWWAGSLAVATDAMHSFLDAGANVIALFALKLAHAPPDQDHPYGHRKFEIVAAVAIGVIIAIGVVQFGWNAVSALLEGHESPEAPAAGFAVVGGTLVVNVFVAAYEARRGRELKSPLLLADAGHTASDVAVTIAVLGALAASRFGVTWADPVVALVVLAFVARVAWGIVAANLRVLVDTVVVDADRVRAIALSTDGVLDCYHIRSRGTEHAVELDLYVQLSASISLRRAHDIAHAVEDALREQMPDIVDVVIHMEPEGEEPKPIG